MESAAALALQASDPALYPAVLSTTQPGSHSVEHRLFRALAPAQAYTDPVKALQGLQELPWTPQESFAETVPGDEGWLVFLSYEFAGAFWPTRLQLPQSPGFPLLTLQRVRLEAVDSAPPPPLEAQRLLPLDAWEEEPADSYLEHVQKIREYILAGDVYQVNLTRRWVAEASGLDPSAIQRRLLAANPAPFSLRYAGPGFELLSSSPERLFAVRGRSIRTQPIAGTRPRGRDGEADGALRAQLLANPKEGAEHLMLVDLERNDLGRVAEAGSVRVPRLMAVEPFATVQHLVSDVEATLRPEVGLADIVGAVFPGGTITGCPKLRCMQIIAELEGRPRMAYTGSFGYCMDSGVADMNILIRTLLLHQGRLHLDAGAGIVADSDAQAELEETRAKARGVLSGLALGQVL